MLEEAFLQTLKERLKSNLETINHELQELQSEAKEDQEVQIEDVDRAVADYDELEKSSRLENLQNEKSATEAALKKIEEGRFGLCEKCGQTIDKARLEVLPSARLCMQCKIICDNCGEEIEEARILGKKIPLTCQNCDEETESETTFTSGSIRPA